MNSDRYSCNVIIAGLMVQLSYSPEDMPPVSLWGTAELELDFRYGSGVVEFYNINKPSRQVKQLGIAEGVWITFFFSKGERLLKVHLI